MPGGRIHDLVADDIGDCVRDGLKATVAETNPFVLECMGACSLPQAHDEGSGLLLLL
jgi:hypothetical protein